MGQAAGEDVYYPYVEQNANADKTMVYTRSDGTSTYPGAYSTSIPNSSVCTTCVVGETTLHAGQANYVQVFNNRNRWGDYHGAAADPDFLGIWVEGEYVASTDRWGTEILPSYNTYAPIDSPSSSSLNFGNQAIFSTSASQAEFFTNNGNATLRITGSVHVTGDSDFFLTFDSCSFAVLQKGASCEVDAAFHPNTIGSGSATINVPDNTSAGLTQVPLSGTGVRAATSATISSSLNPSTFTQSVTFKAKVISSTSGTPTGTLTFFKGSVALGTRTLSGGTASLATSGLSGGTHLITAHYSGDAHYLASVSSALHQVVKPAATATSVASSRNPSSTCLTFSAGRSRIPISAPTPRRRSSLPELIAPIIGATHGRTAPPRRNCRGPQPPS